MQLFFLFPHHADSRLFTIPSHEFQSEKNFLIYKHKKNFFSVNNLLLMNKYFFMLAQYFRISYLCKCKQFSAMKGWVVHISLVAIFSMKQIYCIQKLISKNNFTQMFFGWVTNTNLYASLRVHVNCYVGINNIIEINFVNQKIKTKKIKRIKEPESEETMTKSLQLLSRMWQQVMKMRSIINKFNSGKKKCLCWVSWEEVRRIARSAHQCIRIKYGRKYPKALSTQFFLLMTQINYN